MCDFIFFAAESRSKADDISSLPLDAKLVPKQLIKGQAEKNTPSLASTALAVTTAVNQGKKKAKKSTEKKQERKAAKTLSAILLAFILIFILCDICVKRPRTKDTPMVRSVKSQIANGCTKT